MATRRAEVGDIWTYGKHYYLVTGIKKKMHADGICTYYSFLSLLEGKLHENYRIYGGCEIEEGDFAPAELAWRYAA